jgi:dTDP-4-dehydrorhamnose 3,5-epimerase
MQFRETSIPGAFLIDLEPRRDERGFFARAWCEDELEAHGLCSRVVQCNIGNSDHAGTIRGLHWQCAPHAEVKVVRCTHGAIYDVIVDVRPDSPTCGQHFAVELSAANHQLLYIPEGIAHGYQTLTDGAEIFYQASERFVPAASLGLRYNDPALGIAWPLPVSVIAPRDLTWPDFAAHDIPLSNHVEFAA